LEQKGRRPQIVHGYVEEALDLLLVQIHGDDVGQARGAHHLGQQLGHNAAALAHLALLGIRQVWNHSHDRAGRGSLAGVGHDQQLHDVVVGIPFGVEKGN